ncbi:MULTISPECIES: aspartate/glutamate racemase family protein [Brucella/Ochrobactrum group]|uniref:Aspartate/glutamate racemase family protein n=1 Tax=Ochrobactrum teleogrylli TaxID=2479765 RepID=A0ABD5K489_9HYPH|nr:MULTISPECIES: aspartate/glutamate racemase family protein [Brucella/Ochrobactrum group]MBA8845814.1 aspartate/glutamate racemase [Ochrobactrum sp. RH1CCR137]MBA8857535.1 aspartate/glutamate racemase [Ochrobactrum sp. RH1CCR134]UXO86308.1 aspartate/glutamate racemase family protein [Brucella intermedia]
MTKVPPRIVLFHATPVAMEPIAAAMARHWPEAEAVNLLDDGLTIDRAKEGAEISEELIDRFVDFGRYAQRIGADGILITCSAFGPAIDRMVKELPLPILRPNEAMFREAIASGSRIGMLATFAPAVSTMEEEFQQFVAETGAASTLDTIVVPDAIDLLRRGDATTHNRLVADMAPLFADRDAIMLAHFSTSRAAEEVRRKVDRPVLTAPDAAVMRMKTLVME